MSSKPFLRRKLAVAIGSASLLLPALSGISAVAQAQQAGMLEEIVVTARKREESLQDTPIAVSALSGQALKDAGYTNMQNLTESIPGLTLEGGAGTGGAAAPYIRGVGQRDTNETLEPGVAIYVDGVYQGRPDGALMDFVDVGGIQVLRGPQGTLFGKNSTGGAMVINTNRPTDQFEGDLLLRAGNYNRRDAQLTVNVPLIDDTLYSRFSFSSVKRDGWSYQKAPGTDTTIGKWDDEDRLTGQAQFRWLASDNVTVDLNATWGKQRERGRGAHCLYTLDRTDIVNPFAAPYSQAAIPFGTPALPFVIELVTGYVIADPQGQSFQQSCKQQDLLDDDEFYASTPGRYENDVKGLSLTVDWQLGAIGAFEDMSLKSITAWRAVDTIQNQEIDGTELPLIDRTWDTPRQSDQYSQEFQLNFTAMDGRLKGVSGLFLYNEQTVDGLQNSLVGPFTLADDAIPGAMDDMIMPAEFGGAGFLVGNYQTVWAANRAQKLDTKTDTAALFTELSFDVNEIVSVTGGLRYNWEKKGLEAAFYEADNLPGKGIYEADDAIPELVAQNLIYDFNDGLGPRLVQSARDVLSCNVFCDISVFGLGEPGYKMGNLIPGGTGFFISNSALIAEYGAATPELARKYIMKNATKKWIGTVSDSKVDRSWTPMFNIKFTATDDLLETLNLDAAMSYFTYSRGFKSGGIVAASILSLQQYDPEKVDNYEIGLKIDALGRTLRMNIAAFHMDYEDIQVTVATADPFNPVDVGILQSNAGIASISGVEWETTWLPFEGMMIQLNTAYTNAKYETFEYSYVSGLGVTDEFDRADFGEPLPAVPQWTAYLALQYSFFGDFGALTPRVDASYKSGYSGHFDFVSYQSGDYWVPEMTLFNASLSWELPDDKTRVRAWVRNIENKRYRTSLSPIPEIVGGGSYGLSAPRTYGVDFQYRF